MKKEISVVLVVAALLALFGVTIGAAAGYVLKTYKGDIQHGKIVMLTSLLNSSSASTAFEDEYMWGRGEIEFLRAGTGSLTLNLQSRNMSTGPWTNAVSHTVNTDTDTLAFGYGLFGPMRYYRLTCPLCNGTNYLMNVTGAFGGGQ